MKLCHPGLVLAFILVSAATTTAAPKLSSASLRYGYSVRIPPNGWAHFEYQIDNPDPEPVEVRLVLRPHGQRNMTIYETTLTALPGYRFRTQTMVSIGTVEKYTVELYAGGNLIQSEDMLIRLALAQARIVQFLNDEQDLSYGPFSKNENLHDKYVSSSCRARKMPTHWAGYDRTHLLVVMRPDFKLMSSRQMGAVMDFAARGGSVLFADPRGVIEAYDTPLQQMLPVTPLRLRKLDVLTDFEKLGGKEVVWPAGTDFLESVPAGDGITTVAHGDFPLIRWRRFGLGYVGMCAVNPSQKEVQRAGSFDAVWRHLLRFGGHLDFVTSTPNRHISKALDALTGIKIPKREWIRRCILSYLAVILVFVLGGMVTGRRAGSWTVLAVLAVIATAVTFVYARARMSVMGENSAAVLEFVADGVEDTPGEQVISLFSKSEQTLDVAGDSVAVRLRNLLPPPKRFGLYGGRAMGMTSGGMPAGRRNGARTTGPARRKAGATGKKQRSLPRIDKKKDEVVTDVLTISHRDGRAALHNLLLRQYAPKSYATLFSTDRLIAADAVPAVNWGTDLVTMADWQLPAAMPPVSHAALLCENGYIPVSLHGRQCRVRFDGNTANLVTPSPEITALRDCLSATRSPAPALALFVELRKDVTEGLPAGFTVTGRRVYLIPVRQELPAGMMRVPPQRIRLETNHGRSRMLKFADDWAPVNQRAKEGTYDIYAFLPAGLYGLRPRSVEIEFVADNRGRNLEYAMFLRPAGAADDAHDLPSVLGEDGIYRFTQIPEQGIFSPDDGRFIVVLKSRTIKEIRDPVSALRVNTWQIQKLNVSVTGELAPEYAGKL